MIKLSDKYGYLERDFVVGDIVECICDNNLPFRVQGRLYHIQPGENYLDHNGTPVCANQEHFKTISSSKNICPGDTVVYVGNHRKPRKDCGMREFKVKTIKLGRITTVCDRSMSVDSVRTITINKYMFNPRIFKEEIRVSCKSEKQAETLLAEANTYGLKWGSGNKFTSYHDYRPNVYYNLFVGRKGKTTDRSAIGKKHMDV